MIKILTRTKNEKIFNKDTDNKMNFMETKTKKMYIFITTNFGHLAPLVKKKITNSFKPKQNSIRKKYNNKRGLGVGMRLWPLAFLPFDFQRHDIYL